MKYSTNEIQEIYTQPLLDLITTARNIHQQNFSSDIELCHLISVKTGGCPEDCKYCSQSIHNESQISLNPLLPITEVEKAVINAKKHNIKRICVGAAYRSPSKSAIKTIIEYIKLIKQHNLEACATLGSISKEQAEELKHAGLDYYNHNLDTSPEYYPKVISTRTFNDRISTIRNIAKAGIEICCGGILGLGETQIDRINFIKALTELPATPSSIPINTLIKIAGTKISDNPPLDKYELVRVIATIRIIFPNTRIRLAAGRNELTELEQTLLFVAGINSIFFGDKLLTTPNNPEYSDNNLIAQLTKSLNSLEQKVTLL